ncbi:RNA-binding protein 33 isoform X2 [Pseudomyrmex gracilis]|nr:RNA-binding protein 33 isoform X2 [Pseudomyrmex gracilis]XP_020286988.1 RNA-binding protein 33 isoform X2 [Pseudomyrmex gracilis]
MDPVEINAPSPRIKRNGARIFKNPPQPHMCIQDCIQGITAPCYVNVLSWEKIAMPRRPSLPVPLYGGMRMPPPRTKTEAIVFAVMANPEVLRINGKNAQDPKKRMNFIELLLDFIEAMNVGVVFARRYTILKDRDITGELKEVWNAVLAIRENEQRPQQETWIDAQPAIPAMAQYPQYMEQQAQVQQQQPPPQPSLPEFVPPMQYHSNIPYGRTMSGDNMHYENYHQPQNPIVPKNEPIFAPGPIMSQQTYGTVPQMGYNVRDISREANILMQKIITAQQQSRMTWPQLPHVNMRPNPYGPTNTSPAPPMNPSNTMKSYQPYIPYQQQQQQPPPPPRMDNAMHVDVRRLQQQQQPPPPPPPHQMHLNHTQSPYEQSGPFNVQPNIQNNALRSGRPHMGVAQKNNATRRQANSPTHNSSCTNCQTKEDQSTAKSKSPVKVLQREILTERQDTTNHTENTKAPTKEEEPKNVPVTDLDEDLKKENTLTRKEDTDTSEAARTVDNSPVYEEKSVKIEKLLQETKETEASATQQSQQQPGPKNPNRFGKGNGRTRRGSGGKSDKGHNSLASEIPKRPQPTMMNNIIKNVFKIGPGGSGEETSSKRKTNGQAKAVANGKATCETEEQQPGYIILKKEAQENVVSEIAQLSIQDCKDTTEVGPVLS